MSNSTKTKKKNPVGHPPKYDSPEELQEKINQYFDGGHEWKEILTGPKDNKELIKVPVFTISGLVLFCGFADRKAFYDYEKKPKFSYTIKRARESIAMQYEIMLVTGEVNPAGPIFALKNFGWSDKMTVEHDVSDHYFDKYKDLTNEELENRFDALCGRN